MQTGNDNKKIVYDDPTWHLIAEYSLGEVPVAEGVAAEFTVGSIFQTMRELGLPTERFKRIVETITETAVGMRGHFSLGSPDLPVHICLFCQRKTIEDILHSGDQKKGGWGYYVIERGIDLPSTSCREYDRLIELYLYKECE